MREILRFSSQKLKPEVPRLRLPSLLQVSVSRSKATSPQYDLLQHCQGSLFKSRCLECQVSLPPPTGHTTLSTHFLTWVPFARHAVRPPLPDSHWRAGPAPVARFLCGNVGIRSCRSVLVGGCSPFPCEKAPLEAFLMLFRMRGSLQDTSSPGFLPQGLMVLLHLPIK